MLSVENGAGPCTDVREKNSFEQSHAPENNELTTDLDKPISNLEKQSERHLPRTNGEWDGEQGDSTWHPDGDYVPQKKNPDGQSWQEIQETFEIDGVQYRDGYPVFDDVSKGNVEISDFTTDRNKNFTQADLQLAEQKGCSPEDVEKWRKNNSYTWHECQDMKTMQKVPCIVHNNIPHSGGVSEAKKPANEANA